MRSMRMLANMQCAVIPSLATPDHASRAPKHVKIEMLFFTTHSTQNLTFEVNINTHQELQSSIMTTGSRALAASLAILPPNT